MIYKIEHALNVLNRIDCLMNVLNRFDCIVKVLNYLRISIALSKGNKLSQARKIDLTRPATWEFSAFSQNGEDGILDVLRKQLLKSNSYCIEIGVSDGIQNNTAWLLVAEKYNGIMIEGDPTFARRAKLVTPWCYNMFVTRNNVQELKSIALKLDPDVFSLDIDGNDYYIAKEIIEVGFRPKIFVVEFNSVYGPDKSVTIEYQEDFVYTNAHASHLHYGVSISGWMKFFESHGYKFVTVDTNGVNAFFVDPVFFDENFLLGICGLKFAENSHQCFKFKMLSEYQYKLIADKKLVDI
jgi:hypothetical protein